VPTTTVGTLTGGHAALCPPYSTALAAILAIPDSRLKQLGYMTAHPRGGSRPSFAALMSHSNSERARGMPDAGRTHGPPAAKKAGGSHHRFSRNNRHSPRDGFTLISCSPRCTGLVGHRHPREAKLRRAFNTSVGVSGPHDFTSASLALVPRKPNVHRIPAPRVVTIARNAPLNEAGWAHTITISGKKKQIYFC
jgi:hypothetical protein